MTEIRKAVYDAIRFSDAGPVPVNFARDHGYPEGTLGYVTDNDWYAWRTEAVMQTLTALRPPQDVLGKDSTR